MKERKDAQARGSSAPVKTSLHSCLKPAHPILIQGEGKVFRAVPLSKKRAPGSMCIFFHDTATMNCGARLTTLESSPFMTIN